LNDLPSSFVATDDISSLSSPNLRTDVNLDVPGDILVADVQEDDLGSDVDVEVQEDDLVITDTGTANNCGRKKGTTVRSKKHTVSNNQNCNHIHR
jgi:hypothetical protein